MSKRPNDLTDGYHALATGLVLGSLMKESGDGMLDEVRPFYDAEGNYTNQMLVTINGKPYTVTVEDALVEALSNE